MTKSTDACVWVVTWCLGTSHARVFNTKASALEWYQDLFTGDCGVLYVSMSCLPIESAVTLSGATSEEFKEEAKKRRKQRTNKHIGSSFNAFLEEEGIKKEVTKRAKENLNNVAKKHR